MQNKPNIQNQPRLLYEDLEPIFKKFDEIENNMMNLSLQISVAKENNYLKAVEEALSNTTFFNERNLKQCEC